MLSVIVPVLNEASTIETCLQALQSCRQSGTVEVIVVDGGSGDDTVERALPLAHCVIHAPQGRASQMNAGAMIANGQWLLFLHADTHISAPALHALLTICATEEQAWGRFDLALDNPRSLYRTIELLINLRSRLSGIATGDQAMFMHRSLFEAVRGFPDVPLMEDIIMSKHLKQLVTPLSLPQKVVTSARRWEQRGAWSTILLMWSLRAAYALGVSPQRLHKIYYPG